MNKLPSMSHDYWTLRDYIRILFRQKAVIIISFFTIMPIVAIGLILHTPLYEASVKMLVSGMKQVDAPYYKELLSARDVQAILTQSEIVTSDPILERVIDVLHLDQKPFNYEEKFASPLKRWLLDIWAPFYKFYQQKVQSLSPGEQNLTNYRRSIEDLRKNIKVEPVRDTNVFVIKVKDFDPVGAAIIANVVSRSYVIFDLEQQLVEVTLKYADKHPTVVQLQDHIQSMMDHLAGQPLPNSEAIGPASVKIIEQASVPLHPTGPGKKLVLLAGFLTSIFLGIILAFVFEHMDQTIKSPLEVEKRFRMPLLGSIPYIRFRRHMIMNGAADKKFPQRYTGALENLTDQILVMMNIMSFKMVLFTATNVAEGTTTIVANLATILAEYTAKNVLVVDANYHNGAMQKIFNLVPGPGLVDVLMGRQSLSEAIRRIHPYLSILPAGQTDHNSVLFRDSSRIKEVIKELKNQFDVILIDCAELKSHQDGCMLASLADKTIFVICENQTHRLSASKALSSLEECKAQILGAVMNKRIFPIPKFVYERV